MLRMYLGDLTHETVTVSSDTMPLNVGYLAAALKEVLGKHLLVELFKSPKEMLDKIKGKPPDIVGVSNYCWNLELSHFVLERAKHVNPDALTVMGGPNFPSLALDKQDFLKSYSAIDFYVCNEGEVSFCGLISDYLDWGCFDLGSINRVRSNIIESEYRIKNLDNLPSPYLSGVMDKFFETSLNPFIQTNRGCPFSCTYCHEGGVAYNKVEFFNLDRVVEELDYIGKRVRNQQVLTIADSNFGMFERDLEICEKIREMQDEIDYPKVINVTTTKTRPDLVLEMIKVLKPGSLAMTVSVQSMDKAVLKNIKRKNIPWQDHMKIQKELHKLDPSFKSMSEVIIPLPGETKESFLKGIEKIVDSGVDRIVPYTLMMLPGTVLSSKEQREKYNIITAYRVVPCSYSEYEGQKIIDPEEVAIGTKDMPFEDYVFCRKMSLYLNLVYNGQFYGELIKYLKENDVDVFDWLVFGLNNPGWMPYKIKGLFNGFVEETKTELWDSKEDLFKFYKREATFKMLVDGKAGSNLLHKYWVDGIVYNFTELTEYVFEIASDFLPAKAIELGNIARYTLAKKNDFFGLKHQSGGGGVYRFGFDLKTWEEDKSERKLLDFKRDTRYRISNTPKQREILEKIFQQYGKTPQAIGKISTRVDIRGLWRKVVYDGM